MGRVRNVVQSDKVAVKPVSLGGRNGQRRYLQPTYRFGKRIMDVTVSLAALIVLSPLLVLLALAILVMDGWPIFFTQQRVGRDGKLFRIYKLRTMVKDAERALRKDAGLLEEYKKNYKISRDPRITRLGTFLRKSSFDELPQLFNVLKGEMALVGPRPIVEPELERYGDGSDVYLQMKPGCAGLWQCQGRSSTSYEERVAYDTEYFDRASIRYDIWILFRTFAAILSGRGAR